jgi:ketosteroid isomerase-like protein
MNRLLLLPFILFATLVGGCASVGSYPSITTPDSRTSLAARQYFDVYTKRQDFARFMGFYADNAVLEDMIYGHHAKSKAAIRAFLNWADPKFKMSSSGVNLVVEQQTIDGNIAVTQGYFNAFQYDDKPMGPWRFVIWLEFNDAGKIIRHIDWINYTPREGFLGGLNMNLAIKS